MSKPLFIFQTGGLVVQYLSLPSYHHCHLDHTCGISSFERNLQLCQITIYLIHGGNNLFAAKRFTRHSASALFPMKGEAIRLQYKSAGSIAFFVLCLFLIVSGEPVKW